MTELTPDLPRAARASNSSAAEVPFHVSELFFSRTDPRGVIQSGNSVFQRVSGFEWDELTGAPHKIVRHPDMPRGVFQMLWDSLKAEKPVGFYAKNRDKAGRYYWVFALASPIEGGYLSIRLKPTSDILDTLKPIYEELKRREDEEELKPSESAEALVAAIKELGYPSYDAFQSAALAEEFEARYGQLGKTLNQMLKRVTTMADAIRQVEAETDELTEAFKAIRTVPMNMRIIASRLESAGGPISAISVNYSQMLEEMSTWVKTFVEGDDCVFSLIRDAILNGQFLAMAAALAEEMVDASDEDRETQTQIVNGEENGEHGLDDKTLDTLRKRYIAETGRAVASVETEAMRFGRSVLDMKRFVTGLSSTRMMCKIESASLSNSGTALTGIVDQLDACQDEIEDRLGRIVELNSIIQSNTSMLRSYF